MAAQRRRGLLKGRHRSPPVRQASRVAASRDARLARAEVQPRIPHIDHARRIRKRQRTQQHIVDHPEQGGVEPDPQRQRQNDRRRPPRFPRHAAESEEKLLQHPVHQPVSPLDCNRMVPRHAAGHSSLADSVSARTTRTGASEPQCPLSCIPLSGAGHEMESSPAPYTSMPRPARADRRSAFQELRPAADGQPEHRWRKPSPRRIGSSGD